MRNLKFTCIRMSEPYIDTTCLAPIKVSSSSLPKRFAFSLYFKLLMYVVLIVVS